MTVPFEHILGSSKEGRHGTDPSSCSRCGVGASGGGGTSTVLRLRRLQRPLPPSVPVPRDQHHPSPLRCREQGGWGAERTDLLQSQPRPNRSPPTGAPTCPGGLSDRGPP